MRRFLVATLIITGLSAPLLPVSATAQGFGIAGPNDRRPTDIEADNGIEWRQNEQVYIARGNAKATRGTSSVYADTLIAHYRTVASAAKKAGEGGGTEGGGSSEIYRVEATGNVRLATETQTVYGDNAIYDLDRATAVVTGRNLRLLSPRVTVTARDSLEWYDDKQVAVARGDAVATRVDGRRLAADILTAQVVKPPDAASRISRIDAQGHVLVSTANEIARGSSGVYNVDTGIATLMGDVTITRGESVSRSKYAVVDLNNNVSRLLNTLPGGGPSGGPVEALIVPKSANDKGDGKTDSSQKPTGGNRPTGSVPAQ